MENQPNLTLGLTHVLVEQLGALDVEEVAAHLFVLIVGPLRLDLLGQRVCDRLRNHGLATTWGAVQENALWRRKFVFKEQVTVQERQFDGIGDGFDLRPQATNVVVANVGDVFEHQVFDLGARKFLECDLVRRIDPDSVA